MKSNAFAIQPIRTEADYAAALKRVAPYFDNEPETDSPVDAIKFRMEQQGLQPKDLEPMIGRVNRVYEVLNGKRKLTMAMAWKLHTTLGIPAESLIRPLH